MRRSLPRLQSVQIETPCREDWRKMRGDRVRRYCDCCQLHVHDLTAMMAAEAEELLRNSDGRVCIRLARDKRGRPITLDRFTPGLRLPFGLTRTLGQAVAAIVFLFHLAGCRFTGTPVPASMRAVPGEARVPRQCDERAGAKDSSSPPVTQPAPQSTAK
jgi:hypothetical protein